MNTNESVVETIKLKDIKPYPDNVKIHNQRNVSEIARSISTFGYIEYGVIDENNELLAGHGRYLALLDLKYEEAPFIRASHLSPEEKRLYRIADNVLTEKSKYNMENLEKEVKSLKSLGGDISLTFLTDGMLKKIGIDLELTNLGDEIPANESNIRNYPINEGDIIALGGHTLLCGDSTKKEDVIKLFNGKMANLVVTSPPYFNQRAYSQFESYESYSEFIKSVIKNFKEIENETFVIAWNVGSSVVTHNFIPADHYKIMESLGYTWQEWLTWVKTMPVNDFRGVHITTNNVYTPLPHAEPIIVFTKGKLPKFDKSDTREIKQWLGNVWTIANNNNAQMNAVNHSALFPLELPYRLIKCYSKSGDIVYEPFCGGGTTLIASEKTGRICYGIEKSPEYCNSIINIYVNYSGNTKIKINGEEVDYSEYLEYYEIDKRQEEKIEAKRSVIGGSEYENLDIAPPTIDEISVEEKTAPEKIIKPDFNTCKDCDEFELDVQGRRKCDVLEKFIGKDTIACELFIGRK